MTAHKQPIHISHEVRIQIVLFNIIVQTGTIPEKLLKESYHLYPNICPKATYLEILKERSRVADRLTG